MKVARFHVEGACGSLEFGLVDAVFKFLCAQIEVAIPRQFVFRLATKVGSQSVLVLADDARHKDLRLRQGDVGERLARFGEQVRLFHLERLQVHHRQHAIHGGARAMAWCHVVVMLDDVGPLADTNELRVMRPFHLRRRDTDETLHHDVARQCRIPTCRNERRSEGRGGQGKKGGEQRFHRKVRELSRIGPPAGSAEIMKDGVMLTSCPTPPRSPSTISPAPPGSR